MTSALTMDFPAGFQVGVQTSNNRGFTPEEIASRCADKIVSFSDTSHPAIRAQAKAFKDQIEKVLAFYMREAVKSDRTTVYNALMDAGHPELAKMIRNL
jgi:hypothetical protein